MVVVTATEALLWTDGRYFLQAEKELGREWRLMRAGLPSTPEVPAYLKDSLPAGSRVGIDPQLHSAASARTLRSTLAGGGHALVSLGDNLVDRVWGAARPAARWPCCGFSPGFFPRTSAPILRGAHSAAASSLPG